VAGDLEFREKLAELGSQIKAKREALGISIEEASAKTRIRVTYLTAVEAGNDNVAPGSTYFKAFLKTYATFLGLDGSSYSQAYDEAVVERNAPAKPKPRTASSPQDRPREKKAAERAKIIEEPAVPAEQTDAKPQVSVTMPQEVRAEPTAKPVEYGLPGSVPVLRSGAPVTANRELPMHRTHRRSRRRSSPAIVWILLLALIAGGAYFFLTRTDATPEVPPTGVDPNPPNPPELPIVPEPPAPVVVRTDVDAQNVEFTVDRTPIELTIRTLDTEESYCWIRVVADGDMVFENTLAPGAEQEFTAESEIVIRSGKPWVMSLIVNDQDQGLAGEFGPVKDITVKTAP